ncbi:MAG: FimV family protein [Gammaproteobacteria bacterium]|nr:FimV family protein [Gammaproteobacteria bacterium]
MTSALNQPLQAEIELLSVQSGDLDNLAIRLGGEEDFQRVGADRTFFLTKIKFDVVQRNDGSAYVKLSTTDVVSEPFMDFVVEARWPRGRILREFTVLVDPPVLSDEKPAPIQQAAVTPTPAASARPSSRPAPIRQRAQLAPEITRDGALTYGPVKYNDTLWVIASRMRPNESVTVNQMMMALVRNNPNAFYNGNVNQLKAGYVLRIDDLSSLTALNVAKADTMVERQRVEWQARKSGKLMRQIDSPVGGQVAREGSAGTATGQSADQARLKLVAPGSESGGSGSGGEEVTQLKQDLLLAAEALDANRQETEELKSRLTQMEEQLEAMQRLIMLKDDEMLALQSRAGQQPAVAEKLVIEETVAEPETPEQAMAEILEQEGGQDVVTEAEQSAPVPVQAPVPEEEGLLDNPLVLYGGLGALLLLVIAAVLQRRKKMQDGFEESILNVDGGDDALGATPESMTQGGESSMVSDFAMSEMSGMSGIQADAAEVDPISEADVYLAYGRHQQAEDILREALEKEPGRNELKLKMLEVYFAAKNRDSFELSAQEFHETLNDESDPMWSKVVTMGAQLCPGSDLFSDSSAEALQDEFSNDPGAADEDLLDFDFDLDSSADAGEMEPGAEADVFAELEAANSDIDAAQSADDDTGLDFDLDIGAADAPVSEVDEPEEAKDSDNGLDFDVSTLDFDLNDSFGLTEEDIGETPEELVVEGAEDNSLDIDLGDFGDDSAEVDALLDTEQDNAIELDVDDLTSEERDLVTGSNEESDEELGDELSDELDDEFGDVFGDVDEVGTKLDLARAYVDMGDSDGARSILDEVLEEGDDAQKQLAQELLEKMG